MNRPDDHGTELVVGVIGGMGPQATADLLAKLAAAAPVATEQDHLRVLVDSNPKVPDRNRALAGDGPSPAAALAAMAAGLERGGATLLAMACNTAHAFAPGACHRIGTADTGDLTPCTSPASHASPSATSTLRWNRCRG
jgi:aspartate/glutamate racemase